ncbi:MAG: ornithine cyclodeaminase family protein [Dehalococcoidia bacterium]
MTLLLGRDDVVRLIRPADLVAPMARAFVDYTHETGPRALRLASPLPGAHGTATVLFPGTAVGIPVYSVKVHSKFPNAQPPIRGILCLFDVNSGDLLAVMDSTLVTAVRTGIAGAMAADILARPDARAVTLVGAGTQGEWLLRALALIRPIERVRAYDLDDGRARVFATRLQADLNLPIEACDSLTAALAGAAIVLTATWARSPFLTRALVAPGSHISTMGPDEPGKFEVAGELLRDAVVICDDRTLAVSMGVAQGVGLGTDVIDGELGEVLAHVHPGRSSDDQVTVFGGVGLAFQDAVAAWQVYLAARENGQGHEIDLLA